MKIRQLLYRACTSNRLGSALFQKIRNYSFPGSASYWEKRYAKNGNSGVGSYGENALYKANVINQFVEDHNVHRIIELGCGDGNQLKQFDFPEYIGLDVSPTAVRLCLDIFKDDPSKQFFLYDEKTVGDIRKDFKPELSLSLDVIYHLVEDRVYEKYMRDLFSLASRYVIIYAWDTEQEKNYHVRHRNFSKWIENNIARFRVKETIRNPAFCDFFIYEKIG